MSHQYVAVGWNRQKRIYDGVLALGAAIYIGLFVGLGAAFFPSATAETLLIRALGTLSFFLLHVILSIGPLCRLNRAFLPLLYNRRHLGVTMFVVALAHGIFSVVQFHGFGDVNPMLSLLTSNTRFDSFSQFPFQQLGLLALLILFLMASTSHDFWLKNLTPETWKRLHMSVYVAYALLVAHVTLGALQTLKSAWWAALLLAGLLWISGLHIAAGMRERRIDRQVTRAAQDGFIDVCEAESIPDQRATVVPVGGERVAIFRNGNRISALSNVCRHQNGPLGEGRIIDGCVTCPWHGYQYLPESGASPPPFTEKVPTYQTRVVAGRVWLHPCAMAPGTPVAPSIVHGA